MAVVFASIGESQQAEQSYQTAIRLDPNFLPVRFNFANFYNGLGRNGEAYYSLGLVLAEVNRLEE